MSIAKLFVKVFGENIFDELAQAYEHDESQSIAEDGAMCSAPHETRKKPEDMNLKEQMLVVKTWMNDRMNDIEDASRSNVGHQRQQAALNRLGPDLVIFNIKYTTTMRVSSDKLSLRSLGSFNTIKANVCVYGGQWMYELQLHSKGVMQIGWCSNQCTFSENSGVGDTKLSYGFDGSKKQLWHISTSDYGERWQIGDIIGVTIDVDKDKIEFYRNGNSMGVAFKKLEKGPGHTFFPAVSLGFNQGLQANFGGRPFRYPVEGFMPLQATPFAKIEKSELLLQYLSNLAGIVARYNICKDFSKKSEKNFSTRKIVYVVFSTLLIEKLAAMLFDSYVIEKCLMATIKGLYNTRLEYEIDNNIPPGHQHSVLGVFLSIFWNYLEGEEMRYVVKKLCNLLLADYTHTHRGNDYSNQLGAINIMNALSQHPRTRRTLLEYQFFKKHCLPLFLYIRPPEFNHMTEFLPDALAWTEGIGGPKTKYLDMAEKLRKACEPLYGKQKELLINLLNNDDGDDTTPSSRKIFLAKFRRYVADMTMEQRPFIHFFEKPYPIESKVSLAFICVLIDVTKTLFERELATAQVEILPKYFFDGTFEYPYFDRLGGVISHLRKVHRNEIAAYLGIERTQELMNLEPHNITVRVAAIDQSSMMPTVSVGRPVNIDSSLFTPFLNNRIEPVIETPPGKLTAQHSLSELLDCCVMYYYCAGHKYIVKTAAVRDEIAALNEVLMETKFYREDVERKLKALEDHASVCMNESHCHIVSDLKAKFGQRENVFAKRSIALARKQCWFRAVGLGKQRRALLVWLLEKNLRTLNAACQTGPLFSFVPEVYVNVLPILLDAVMDFSYHDLYVQFEVTDAEYAVNTAADFLSLHSADPRIILASCKDSLLQALGTITCHKAGIKALERTPKKSQFALIRALLRTYENRAWGQSNWLLLRFWLGDGFAYRDSRQPSVWQGGNTPIHKGLCRSRAKNETHTGLLHYVAPAFPSKHFQRAVGLKLTEDEAFATTFLNSVLSQVNWAFSEFILLLQEIQNTAQRQETTVFDPKQLKICSMCFELTVSLLRCLEFVITVAPEVFHDASRPNSDLLLTGVCQLISQVLSRVTVPPGCFQFVVDMCSADLNAVTHFPIITAALGILIALLRPEIESDESPAKITRISRTILTEASFQFANLEFALGEVRTPILQQNEIPRGNFDPQTRAHIDPLTNDVRVPMPSTSAKRIRSDPPIIGFSLRDFPTHVTPQEIEVVEHLIEMLRSKQTLLSDITLPSEDSLCPICCAKPIAVVFYPCGHQSCSNCILQHLINSKVCFYCKSMIKSIESADGTVIYQNNDMLPPPVLFDEI